MMRKCDGTDPNLLMLIDMETGQPPCPRSDNHAHFLRYEPCDCGLSFDDVTRMVIYPHLRVGGEIWPSR